MRLHSPVLVTEDLARLQRFYTEVLGFEVRDDFGACVVLSCGLSLWQPGATHPVQPRHQEAGPGKPPGHAFELCFETDSEEEFERVATALSNAGLSLLHAVREEPWGQRTLRLLDPDGHLVEWGESVPCFVRRLHASGLDVDQVAARTGVSVEQVATILDQPG